jgi:hypothetical protein
MRQQLFHTSDKVATTLRLIGAETLNAQLDQQTP